MVEKRNTDKSNYANVYLEVDEKTYSPYPIALEISKGTELGKRMESFFEEVQKLLSDGEAEAWAVMMEDLND